MIAPDKLFGNFFEDRKITSPRLANFATDCTTRLAANNTTGDYTPLINLLTPLLATFAKEIGEVDTTKAQQKGKTLSLNQQVAAFKKTMSAKEGVIADALDGKGTPAYLEFYPKGVTEYSKATKTQMPVLVKRVNMAATTHAAKLSPTLVAMLQGFEVSWDATRTEQTKVKGMVSDNRTDRGDARTAVEQTLLVIIHTLAAKFPGDSEQCMAFFDFNLLEGVGRSSKAKAENK
jgi:hypothetical protein